MRSKIIALIVLAIDIAMAAMEWRVFSEEWPSDGPMMLRFYTQSSNVLAMIVCAICALTGTACLIFGWPSPRWAQVIRYVATCCLMVTFIVAACILVPLDPGQSFKGFMLRGNLLYLHTVCPLLMLAGYMISGGEPLTVKHAAIAVIPTVIYGVITIVMLLKRVYTAPYFFFQIHRQPWYETVKWMAIIVGGDFAVSWLLTKMQLRIGR